ncbi:hypothetical protein WJX74_006793 [Apatococcus lobatus]|uniref:Peroxisomal ATPase PEX6 n=1 Tax=Apatococcus lobatus TaxID=904363 RepID=A0AAW1SEU4_9CHLO
MAQLSAWRSTERVSRGGFGWTGIYVCSHSRHQLLTQQLLLGTLFPSHSQVGLLLLFQLPPASASHLSEGLLLWSLHLLQHQAHQSIRQITRSCKRQRQGRCCYHSCPLQDCSRAMEWITLWTSQKAKAAEHQFEDTDSSLDIVEALQAHFQECPRLVSQGQVFAIADPAKDPQQELLAALCSAPWPGTHLSADCMGQQCPGHQQECEPSWQHPASCPHLLWFKVTSVEPQGATPLAVDPHTTAVHMEGTCSSPLPVGAEFFKDANSSKESSSTCTGGGAILGRSLAAAWHTQPCLPGLPYLLPAWRDIATILAPLVHQGARGRRVRVALLLAGPAGCGRTVAAAAAAAALGLHLIPFSCHDLSSAAGPQAQSKALALALRTAGETAADFSPALLLLRNFEALANSVDGDPGHPGEAGLLQLLDELERLTASPESKKVGSQSIQTALDRHDKGDRRLVLVVACVFALADVPPLLRRIFTHEVEVEAPSLDERAHLLEGMLCQDPTAQSHVPWLQDAAAQTAGLFPRDLRAAAADALAMAAVPGAISIDSGQITIDGLPLPHSAESVHQLPPFLKVTAEHMEKALLGVKRRTATALGAPSVPKVKWEDVGGLEEVKQGVLDTVELPLRHPSLFAAGLKRRSGVLLYGPPGTGKTLIAKAVATECSINFLSVKGPELINMYIGESERQVREIFARARRARPCVLFFDELDSLAPARGAGSDSGGVMDRVVSQLLAEIDGVQSGGAQDLFIIGATNRPDLLDSALLRPGRLDRLLYVGVAEDPGSKHNVLCALTRSFKLAADVDLKAIAQGCQLTFTGADMYALCSDAWMAGLKRTIREHEALQRSQKADTAPEPDSVIVSQADFWDALSLLQPSLSEQELQRYAALRDQYNGPARRDFAQ